MDLKEKREILFRKQRGKQVIDLYLEELNNLFNSSITKDNLLSLEVTDEIISKLSLERYKLIKTSFDFKDKAKLSACINDLIKLYSGPVLVFTSYSEFCGAVEVSSLARFNVDFNYKDEHAGIISVISKDLKNKLLIDFYEEQGDFFITIETRGVLWSKNKIGYL